MLGDMNSSGKNKNILDKILHSVLSDKDMVSMSRRISTTDLLRKLKSDDIDKTSKLIFLVLVISQVLDKMRLSDFAAMFDKAFSQPTIVDQKRDLSREQTELFINKYKIRESDKQLIAKIIEGISLKEFKKELNISQSNANKKIRALWQRLGLENREQLIFIAGWMRLISPNLSCLNRDEGGTNLSKR